MEADVRMSPGWRESIIDSLRPAMSRFVGRVGSTARRDAPIDTGKLASSIHTQVRRDGTGEVELTAHYAVWVTGGTGLYGPHHTRIVPRRAPFLVFKPKGSPRTIYARSVRGQEPQPFLVNALNEELGRGFQ